MDDENEYDDDDIRERIQIQIRLDVDVHKWLKREKRKSGRSMSWMVNSVVSQWRDRLEKGRKDGKEE